MDLKEEEAMFETSVFPAILILLSLLAMLYPFVRRRKTRPPTLNHFLLASGSVRRAEQDWMLRQD